MSAPTSHPPGPTPLPGAAPLPGPTATPGPTAAPGGCDARTGVVLITWNRREEALLAVRRLLALPERPRVVVVDNASTDGTERALRERFADACAPRPGGAQLEVLRLAVNEGAVARNHGVQRLVEVAGTRYVAFCDDDTWWAPGALARAGDVLDDHPDVAVLTARILVEPAGTEDPIVAELRESPVRGRPGLPGPALGSFLAGASVVRAGAFTAVGGFSRRLWLGGEEELLAADLATAGWELCYLPDLTVHHQASALREPTLRRRHGIRNTIWFTLLRRPPRAAGRRLRVLAATVPRDRTSALAVWDAARGLPWVLRERRALPPRVEARFLALEDSQTRSTARRYVG